MRIEKNFIEYIESHSWDNDEAEEPIILLSDVKKAFEKYIIPDLRNLDNIRSCLEIIENNINEIENDLDIEVQ